MTVGQTLNEFADHLLGLGAVGGSITVTGPKCKYDIGVGVVRHYISHVRNGVDNLLTIEQNPAAPGFPDNLPFIVVDGDKVVIDPSIDRYTIVAENLVY